MTDDDLTERLRRLGSDRVPSVDGAFANRLEADLRDIHDRPPHRSRIPDLLVRPVAVLAALVIVVGVVAVLQRDDDRPGVAMVAADGTTVSIPGDASLVPGRAGLDLPDGTRIEVAEGGAAVVDGVVLEAGSSAVVVDGRIELLRSPTATATDPVVPSTTTTPTTTGVPTTAGASTAPTPTDTSASATTDPPRTTVAPTTGPRPSDSQPSTTTDTDSTTTSPPTTNEVDATTVSTETTRAPSESTTEPPPTSASDRTVIGLVIGPVRDGEATLMWQVDGPTDAIAGWEVRIEREGATRSIAFIRFAEARRLRVEVPDQRVAYRVIARSGGDGVLARSPWVSPGG